MAMGKKIFPLYYWSSALCRIDLRDYFRHVLIHIGICTDELNFGNVNSFGFSSFVSILSSSAVKL